MPVEPMVGRHGTSVGPTFGTTIGSTMDVCIVACRCYYTDVHGSTAQNPLMQWVLYCIASLTAGSG